MKMSTNIPTQKITAATLAGALTQIIALIVQINWPDQALDEKITDAISVILTFVVGYYTPAHARDTLATEGQEPAPQPAPQPTP